MPQKIRLANEKLISEMLPDFGISQAKPKATSMDGAWKYFQNTDGAPLPADNRYREALGKLLYPANTTNSPISPFL